MNAHQRSHAQRRDATRVKRASDSSSRKSAPLPPAHPFLRLQRSIGNQAVNRIIQAKLMENPPDDEYEREADRVAAEVVSGIGTPGTPAVQRQEAPEDEDEAILVMKPVSRMRGDRDGIAVAPDIEPTAAKASGGGQPLADNLRTPIGRAFGGDLGDLRIHVEAQAAELNQMVQPHAFMVAHNAFFRKAETDSKPNNTGLPDNLKSGIESLSGISLDHVKVHYNSAQPAHLNALAYASGGDIHVAPGQERHLPHEAWHVVQQAQGRVQPTMQRRGGLPVNDDAGLEHEAVVMGARADAGVEHSSAQKAFRPDPFLAGACKNATVMARSPTRYSKSYTQALPASLGSVSQLVNLPSDSTGKLSDMKLKISDENTAETEITGEELQIYLIEELSRLEGVKEGFGYRLVSFRYDGKVFEKDINDYHLEKHGMQPWPGDIDEHLEPIRMLTEGTLRDSGQLGYLNENFEKIDATHAIIIDVDWYLQRTQSDVGFHKDSRGTTLFVNLTYNNPEEMQGAATKYDREGQPELEKTFPEEVKKDLDLTRKSYEAITPHEQFGDLKEEKVSPYARLSFSDPGVWHSTPLLGHRVEKLPPPKDVPTLQKYLVRAGYQPYIYMGILNYYNTRTPANRQAAYDHFVGGEDKVTTNTDLMNRLLAEGFKKFEIVGIFMRQSPEEFWGGLETTDKYNQHGISDVIKPLHSKELTEKVKKHSRRLSLDLKEGREQQTKLDQEALRSRTFIRTWVRLVPKPANL